MSEESPCDLYKLKLELHRNDIQASKASVSLVLRELTLYCLVCKAGDQYDTYQGNTGTQ